MPPGQCHLNIEAHTYHRYNGQLVTEAIRELTGAATCSSRSRRQRSLTQPALGYLYEDFI